MRAVLALTVGLALAFSGLWLAAAQWMTASAQNWIAAHSAPGDTASARVQGYPGRFDLIATNLDLADAATGLGWQAASAQLAIAVSSPWAVSATLPPTQAITMPGETVTVTSDRMQGRLTLTPNTDLTLNQISLQGAALAATSDRGWHLAADQLDVTAVQDQSQPNTYAVTLQIANLAPDAALMARLVGSSGLPARLDLVQAQGSAIFTAALDRHADSTQPAISTLKVDVLHVQWGSLALDAKGSVQADAQGRAEGRIDITLQNWPAALMVAQTAGLVTPELAPTLSQMMTLLATQSGDPTTLKLPLSFQAGRMSLGPLPLGPAPFGGARSSGQTWTTFWTKIFQQTLDFRQP